MTLKLFGRPSAHSSNYIAALAGSVAPGDSDARSAVRPSAPGAPAHVRGGPFSRRPLALSSLVHLPRRHPRSRRTRFRCRPLCHRRRHRWSRLSRPDLRRTQGVCTAERRGCLTSCAEGHLLSGWQAGDQSALCNSTKDWCLCVALLPPDYHEDEELERCCLHVGASSQPTRKKELSTQEASAGENFWADLLVS